MKRMLLFCLAFSLVTACKKSVQAENYLRMTIDGATVLCDKGLRANKTTSQNNLLSIFGQWQDGSLQIQVFNFGNAPGTWLINGNLGSSPRFTLYIGQADYYAGDGGFSAMQLGSGQVVILEVNDEFIKGEFEFTTYPTSPFNTINKRVTQGAFYVKRT